VLSEREGVSTGATEAEHRSSTGSGTVFISHSSPERGTAEAICSALEQAGFSCWIAPRDIVPGETWADAIIRGLEESFLMVLVLSASSMSSQQVLREVSIAVNHVMPIIAFRIEDIDPSGAMTYYLGTHQWLDAYARALPTYLNDLVDAARAAAATAGRAVPVSSPPDGDDESRRFDEVVPDDFDRKTVSGFRSKIRSLLDDR
jgi:hypothetical protein